MSIFKCSKCGVAENTALCRYNIIEDKTKALCSECDSKIGKWHNCFDQVAYDKLYGEAKSK